jgi:hypothetical protein
MRIVPVDEAMDEMLSAHLGPACEATGLEPDAIFEIIGDHWQGPLWGCAFEDLLTQELNLTVAIWSMTISSAEAGTRRRRTRPICARCGIR